MHEHVVVDAVLGETGPERDAHITIEDVAFVARLNLEETSLWYLV